MPAYPHRVCLSCGLDHNADIGTFRERHSVSCLKCDADLAEQNNGTVLTRDIAHHHETVSMALEKLDETLQDAWDTSAMGVRLIVGGGRIREEVLSQLSWYEADGSIRSSQPENPNQGSIMVVLR